MCICKTALPRERAKARNVCLQMAKRLLPPLFFESEERGRRERNSRHRRDFLLPSFLCCRCKQLRQPFLLLSCLGIPWPFGENSVLIRVSLSPPSFYSRVLRRRIFHPLLFPPSDVSSFFSCCWHDRTPLRRRKRGRRGRGRNCGFSTLAKKGGGAKAGGRKMKAKRRKFAHSSGS